MESFYTQLGALNASLVGAEFADRAPSADQLAVMLRTARSLHIYARQRLAASLRESRPKEEEEEEVDVTAVKDTPCVGPCVYMWRGANKDDTVRELVASMQRTTSAGTARSLFCQVVQLRPPGAQEVETYQMCELTGFPCSVFSGACSTTEEQSGARWEEAVRESRLLEQYAEHVAHSRILQLEAEHSPASGGALRGGAAHRQLVQRCAAVLAGGQAVDVIRSFFKYQPDYRGTSLHAALQQFGHASAAGRDDALDFLVSGDVVEPLARRASALTQPAVRAALTAQWHSYVTQGSSDFSSAQ